MLSSDAVALFLTSRKAKGSRPATIAFYERELTRLTKARRNLPLQPEQIEAIWADVGPAEMTRHGCFRALRALYHWLHKREHIRENPMTRVEAPVLHPIRQRTLDPAEVRQLLALDSLSRRDRTILTLILDAGIRSGELRSLFGRDLREGWIAVRGKTGERQVWVHEETMIQLRILADGPDTPLFRTIAGAPLTKNRLYKIVATALDRVGLASGGKHGAHLLRHTFGRSFIAAEGPLPALKEILGHSSIVTTMIYANLAGVEVRKAHAQFSQLTTTETQRLRRVK